MAGLSVEIDARGINSLALAFGATEKQVEAAMRSTYGKMARWMRTHSLRGLSRKLHIQQKILRSRIRTYRMQNGLGDQGGGAKVWYGLRNIPFSRLNPRRARDGVRAAGRYVEGAFLTSRRGRPEVMRRIGKARLPVEVVYAEIADEAQVYIEDEFVGSTAFDIQFFRFLEHELRWRTQILKSA